MIYRLLGELQISGDDGHPLELPKGAALIVLAALLVNANMRLSKTDLIRAAWGNDDVREAQLHKRVMAIRDMLEPIGRRDDIRTHARFGYELRAATEDIDALLFQRLVRAADTARAKDREKDEIDILRQALRLWRGPHPLSNVPSESFRQDALALEHRHKRAAARLFELELARGNDGRILDELIQTASYYPSDRRICEQLMVAQYRCGHLADVAAAYERYKITLEEEAGCAPDARLRNLHFAIARGDDKAIAAAVSAVTKPAASTADPAMIVPRQLPAPVDLIGRDDLLAEVSCLLRREPGTAARVIVVSGPGGIGKSALALRAAHESRESYPDGQLYAELGGTRGDGVRTDQVVAHFLRALAVSQVPESLPEKLAQYRTLLAERSILIVLEDAADGSQVADLLPANPGCAVLITSRQRLPELADAHHAAPLRPLDAEHSTELFERIVRGAGITADDDAAATQEVVSLCGGLPLALRIAGALQVHYHPRPTAELASRLARQGPEGFTYRGLSLARTIAASYERLDAAGRELFLGLATLPLSGFGLWTAAAVLDTPNADATAALCQLAASFMIESVPSQPRYRFHELTREYARRLAASQGTADGDARGPGVYQALLTLARRAHVGIYGGDFEVVHSAVPDWEAPPEVLAEVHANPLAWFDTERQNIRSAIEHSAELGLTDLCWDLAVSAHEFYNIRGYFDDWLATHTLALEACRENGDRRGEGVLIAILNQPALISSRRTGSTSGAAELRRAADMLAECEDSHGQAIALRTLANLLRRRGFLTWPLALFREALGHYTASGDAVGRWQTLRFIGQTYLDLGDYDEARRMLVEAAALAEALHSDRLTAQTRYWLGETCLAMGDVKGAQSAFDVVFSIFRGDPGLGQAYALHGYGDVARLTGSYAAAEQHLGQAAEMARDAGDAIQEGRVLLSMAALFGARGDAAGQAAELQRAAAIFAEGDAAYLEVQALADLAVVLADQGDEAAAAQTWDRVGSIYDRAEIPAEDRMQHLRIPPETATAGTET